MSETRRDLGPLSIVMKAALDTYARWVRYTTFQKAEMVVLLQTMVNIEIARDSRAAKQQPIAGLMGAGNTFADMQVTDEHDRQ